MDGDAMLTRFDSAAEMVANLADRAEKVIKSAIAEKGAASIALSGGSTPAPLYRALAARDIEWENVHVILVDDRWVAPGQPGSNESFVQETLLGAGAGAATYISLYAPVDYPKDALETVSKRLNDMPWPLDVAVLGMGPDGHTASWFPYAEGLTEALGSDARLAAVTATKSAVTGDYLHRITLTLNAVSAAGTVLLLLSGDKKLDAFQAAAADGPIEAMPVRAIMKDRPDMTVAWCA